MISRSPTHIEIEATRLYFPPNPSGPPLESSEEEGRSDLQLHKAIKGTKHQHKWMVTHITFSDKLDVIYSDFTSGQAIEGSDGSYRSEVVLISAA